MEKKMDTTVGSRVEGVVWKLGRGGRFEYAGLGCRVQGLGVKDFRAFGKG